MPTTELTIEEKVFKWSKIIGHYILKKRMVLSILSPEIKEMMDGTVPFTDFIFGTG